MKTKDKIRLDFLERTYGVDIKPWGKYLARVKSCSGPNFRDGRGNTLRRAIDDAIKKHKKYG